MQSALSELRQMNTACNDKAKDGKCCQIQLDVNVSM